MELNLTTATGKASKNVVQLSDNAFACAYNETLVHQVVTAHLAGGRAGTRAHKSRSQVRGGGAKPWRQKGTGNARAGTSSSPIWRGGGKTFAAVPVSYEQKVNRKMYRSAVRSIVSELLRQERLIVVEEFTVSAPKTKELVAKLEALTLGNVLIVSNEADENLYLAARNLHQVDVCNVANLDPVSLINYDKILMTKDAIKKFEERLV